jgi:hypothetical protein
MHVKFFVDMGATQLTVFMAPVASGDSHLLMGALLGASMEYQDFIALKINLLWWQCGGNVVAMWWQCGGNVWLHGPPISKKIPCKSIRKVQTVARASTFDSQTSNRISAIIIDGGGAAVECTGL